MFKAKLITIPTFHIVTKDLPLLSSDDTFTALLINNRALKYILHFVLKGGFDKTRLKLKQERLETLTSTCQLHYDRSPRIRRAS